MTVVLPLVSRRNFGQKRVEREGDMSAIAICAKKSLLLELETWPKPGLVSHIDSGSHADMDAYTFRASANAIFPFFRRLAEAGAQGSGMGRLRAIGLEAEAHMLDATKGVNTHRGAIFGLGLLCAAAGAKLGGLIDPSLSLGKTVSLLWGAEIIRGPRLPLSHGEEVRRRYGAGGARSQAAQGFPGIYAIGIPALQNAIRICPNDAEAQRVQTCFALIAGLEDTNLLHRAGIVGLRFAQKAAAGFLDDAGIASQDWLRRARVTHQDFVDRNLSPGGAADLLAMTLFVEEQERRIG